MAIHNTKEMDFVMQPGEEDKAMDYDSYDSDEPLAPRYLKTVHNGMDEKTVHNGMDQESDDSDDSDDDDQPLRPKKSKTVHKDMDYDSDDSDEPLPPR